MEHVARFFYIELSSNLHQHITCLHKLNKNVIEVHMQPCTVEVSKTMYMHKQL